MQPGRKKEEGDKLMDVCMCDGALQAESQDGLV